MFSGPRLFEHSTFSKELLTFNDLQFIFISRLNTLKKDSTEQAVKQELTMQ